ncbi:MAG: RNA methyltransferase [Ignavibacteria bacterium]
MITKNELLKYSSLLKKKGRKEENKFIVEGKRLVEEGLNSSFTLAALFSSVNFANSNPEFIAKYLNKGLEILPGHDFERLCDTKTPQGIAAVFEIPDWTEQVFGNGNLIVALNDISDPGNAGTILRTCNWFGITEVLASENTVDLFNPKLVRSSMGSLFHILAKQSANIVRELEELHKRDYRILVADTEGDNIYQFNPGGPAVIVFCNEANGPSPEILRLTDKTITIPKYGRAESLNVASAAAVILSELRKVR